MKFDGPFEVMEQLSPVTYRLRMPAGYNMHPVLNIAHLEPYESSPPEFSEQPTRHLNREDFTASPDYEVEKIVDEKMEGGGIRRRRKYLVRWKDYGPEWAKWLTAYQLHNAPEVLAEWNKRPLADPPDP